MTFQIRYIKPAKITRHFCDKNSRHLNYFFSAATIYYFVFAYMYVKKKINFYLKVTAS